MKFLLLLWITIRASFDASVWATAVSCLFYAFANVAWLQCFWIFLALQLIGELSFVKKIATRTKHECFTYLRRESILVGLSILYAPLLSILPTVAVIVLLSYLQTLTDLETHWLHAWLFVACVVYLLLRGREKRRMGLQVNSKGSRSQGSVWMRRTDPGARMAAKEGKGQAHCEECAGPQRSTVKVARMAQKAAHGSRSARVIDI
jgi:hypothetical protein